VDRRDVADAVFDLLRRGAVGDAINLVAREDEADTRPRSPFFETRPCAESIRMALAANPRAVQGVSDEVLEHLRRAAVMVFLGFGHPSERWLPKGLSTGLRVDSESAVNLLVAYVQERRNILQASQHAHLISGVFIRQGSEQPFPPCPVCRTLEGKRWSLGEQPELPYEHCIHDMGCRCSYEFVYRGE